MTSPNEPGQPGLGERLSAGEGSTEVPPWQSARARAEAAQRPTDVFARTTVASSPAIPTTPTPPVPVVRTETRPEVPANLPAAPLPEAYPSELPDLSGPLPRHRRAAEDEAPRSEPVATSRIQVGSRNRGPVRASMQIRRIDPWSALKVSALLSGALFFVWMIAVAFLYLVLGAMGVWSKLNSNVGDLLTSGNGGGGDLVSAGSIFGGAALIGLVNIVLLTAMATVGAYIYNLSTDIVGGVEVTLADLD